MTRFRYPLFFILSLIWNIGWSDAPIPQVKGSSIHWQAVSAISINVHRGDGSYVESLPGDTTSWEAPEQGDYFLVATNERDWPEWPRSATVTVESLAQSGAPAPFIDRVFIVWEPVQANSINVHRGDGSFVESLPGDSAIWLPLQLGDYFLVATNDGPWQSWPRSEIVTVVNPYTADDVITGLKVITYSQTAAEVFWDRLIGSGIRYQIDKDDETVATINGRSWFFDNLAIGSTSLVSVKAIYPDGTMSNESSVVVMTPAEPTNEPPIINRTNYQTILKTAFETYFGVQYRTQLRNLATTIVNDMRAAANPVGLFPSTYTCINGGEVEFTNPYILQFEDCRERTAVYEGELYIHETYGDTDRISSIGLTITTTSGEQLQFSGSLDGALSEKPGWYEAADMQISVSTDSSTLQVQEANFSYTFPHLLRAPSDPFLFTPYFGGSFKLRANDIDDQLLSVSTLGNLYHSQLFTESADWNYSKGILSVYADDGSRLSINADTGDEDTVFIQLAHDSNIEQFEQAWDPDWAVWRLAVNLGGL